MTVKGILMSLMLVLLGLVLASAYDHTLKLDFPGPYCARQNTCCKDRRDGCSVPIYGKFLLDLFAVHKLIN